MHTCGPPRASPKPPHRGMRWLRTGAALGVRVPRARLCPRCEHAVWGLDPRLCPGPRLRLPREGWWGERGAGTSCEAVASQLRSQSPHQPRGGVRATVSQRALVQPAEMEPVPGGDPESPQTLSVPLWDLIPWLGPSITRWDVGSTSCSSCSGVPSPVPAVQPTRATGPRAQSEWPRLPQSLLESHGTNASVLRGGKPSGAPRTRTPKGFQPNSCSGGG